jgi:prepilin-type N-terminal cleavage/methylation domain-containing protein
MRRAFTLIELMVSIALSMLLVGGAWTMFSQVQRLAKRTQARLQLHATAKSIYESLRRDLTAMQQDCALWLRSPGPSGGATGGIDLVFMTAVADDQGFRLAGNAVSGDNFIETTTDLVWCRWSWTGVAPSGSTEPWLYGRLLYARNAGSRDYRRRQFDTVTPSTGGVTYPILGYYKYGTPYNPQPRRMTAGDDVMGLDDNRWSFNERAGLNIGDWSDLTERLAPVQGVVTACAIELVQNGSDAGGAPLRVTADGGSPLAFCARGVRLDGLTEAATGISTRDEIAQRPSILRIAFTLQDPVTAVSQDFSFSIALPGPRKHL